MRELWARLKGVARRRKVVWSLAVLCVVVGPLTPSFVRLVSDRFAIALAAGGGHTASLNGASWVGRSYAIDPWGRPLIFQGAPTAEGRLYSVGPNGRDEQGGGDDVVPAKTDVMIGVLLDGTPLASVCLACLLVWCLHGPFVHRPRSPNKRKELLRGAVAASGPLVYLLIAGASTLGGPGSVARLVVEPHLADYAAAVPGVFAPKTAFLLTYVAVGLGLGYAWRLRRPAEEGGPNVGRQRAAS